MAIKMYNILRNRILRRSIFQDGKSVNCCPSLAKTERPPRIALGSFIRL